MKKSIPVSDDLNAFFRDPCPQLSDNNSKLLLQEMTGGYDYIVEYGMGASTLYFLKEAEKQKGTFISVENNFDWFEICIEEVKKQTGFSETHFVQRSWTKSDINAFTKASKDTDAPEHLKRHPQWCDRISMGPFYRFSPEASSRYSGKLGPLWPIFKPFMVALNTSISAVKSQPLLKNGEWRGKKNDLTLILRNVAPSIKDQFGEAPNIADYIGAGLKDIKKALEAGEQVSAIFVIDGGPRHKIVEEIFDLEDKHASFNPTIMLCDASRAFYHPTLSKRSSGEFIAGTNKTLKGGAVEEGFFGPEAEFWTGGEKTGDELSKQELWVYRSK